MVSQRFGSQWALIALVWLFLGLHSAWPRAGAQRQRSAEHEPLPPKRPRAKELKPCAGLPQRPPGALWE
jgi:hypothetical protein